MRIEANRKRQHGLVSVVIPAYNMARYVFAAVESVLIQDYPNVEAIVVNDGSTDDTENVLRHRYASDPRVRVVSQENRGLSAARNAGISCSNGEYLSFLDADDVLLPGKISAQVAYLQAHPGVDLVYSDYTRANEKLEPLPTPAQGLPPLPFEELYVYRNWFAPMTPLVRSDLVTKTGGFDEGLRAAEDWDYWLRCARVGKFGYLPQVVALYRTHPTQMHGNRERMWAAGWTVARKNYGDNQRQLRSAIAALWFYEAKHRRGEKRYLGMVAALLSCFRTVPSLKEMRRIIEVM